MKNIEANRFNLYAGIITSGLFAIKNLLATYTYEISQNFMVQRSIAKIFILELYP